MIIDLNTSGDSSEFRCDLCIVGSGAAGLAIASEMLRTPVKVLVVESGGLESETATQALYDVDCGGLPHPGSTKGRFRICGGSTTQWGGQALPLMPLDFECRDWVAHSGWPLTFEKLKPYYVRAAKFLLLDDKNVDTDLFKYLKAQPPAFDPAKIWYHFAKWSPQPNIRERYISDIRSSNNCNLLLHANVTNIALSEDLTSVSRISVSSLERKSATVRSRIYVLCVGGIETARLMLANNRQQPTGIGNGQDLVGRFFQDHPSATIGRIEGPNIYKAQTSLNVFHKGGSKYSVRCTASPNWQRKNRTLNVSMGTTLVGSAAYSQDAKEAFLAIRRRRFDQETARKLFRAVMHPAQSISPVWHFLVHGRTMLPAGARLQIGLTSEQEPNPESRVLLSDRRDMLGMQLSNVCWRLTQQTFHTVSLYSQTLREEFRKAGIGQIDLEDWVVRGSTDWTGKITDQYHHMGTARMNDSPRLGVVDRNCRIHGMTNLYIGSSAVFPTSGHSNPTLTIIALCMRMADLIKSELK